MRNESLGEREQRAWRSYLAMTRLVNEALESQLQRDAGMPFAYFLILRMLADAPGRTLRMNELAHEAGASQSRLSHAITRLESDGLVQRRQCESDKRGFFAVLTDEGATALDRVTPAHISRVQEVLFGALTPEQLDQLEAIGEAVVANAESGAGKPVRRTAAAS